MKTQEVLMMETASHGIRATIAGCQLVAFVCLTLVFAGCKQPAPALPEKSLVRTTEVESMENVRPDGEASYLAMIRAEKETDLSFKVAGILETIGPAPGTDWDEGTPVKAGAVLAELKQADFINALNSARARADLAAFMPSPHHYSSPCRTRAQVALKKFYRSTAPKRQSFTGLLFLNGGFRLDVASTRNTNQQQNYNTTRFMKTENPDISAILKDRRKALTKMTKKNQPNRNQVPVEPSEEEIAIYAYMNWEAEGRPEGRNISHWEQAEEQLLRPLPRPKRIHSQA